MRKIRVLIINTFYPPIEVGGAEKSTGELAEQLAASGIDVTVASLSPRDSSESYYSIRNGVKVYRHRTTAVGPFFSGASRGNALLGKLKWHLLENFRPSLVRYLRRVINDAQPDVIHVNAPGAFGSLAWLIAPKIPRVYTLRDFYLLCSSFRTFKQGKNCESRCASCALVRAGVFGVAQRSAQVVSISQATADRHQQFGAFVGREIEVIPNTPKQLVKERREPGEAVIYGYIGRVEAYKGIWVVLEAFQSIADPAARLVIAGIGSDEDMLRLSELQDSRVSVLGRVPAATFYAQVDVVLVPSQWHESFGRVAAEAYLSGCAVIASNLGGLPEAVEGAAAGTAVLVQEWRTPQAWTDAMVMLREYRSTGANPKADSPANDTGAKYARIYREVLN